MEEVKKQSSFTRQKYNEAKMGAYYTDPQHCRYISRFLQFPEEDEVCCLEPSIGDGKAILTATGKIGENGKNLKIYGVELNDDTYQAVKDTEGIDQCLKADFLNDTIISHNAFSFIFMNPPYGTSEEKTRYEVDFLKKVIPYAAKEAVMVFVLPQYVGMEEELLDEWCSHFETRFVYRFQDIEYEKYKQIVLIGQRKSTNERDKEEEQRLRSVISRNREMPVIPEDYDGERLEVPKSSEKGIEEFMTRIFHADEAVKALKRSPLQRILMDAICVPPYLIDNLARPPIMPSEGQMYLLAVSGAGQGLVGNEENGDLHLQRGVSRIAKRSEYVQDDSGNMKEVEITFPQISYNLIESSGAIRTLQ